ncbi:MAG: enoyl-CoA hydratase/isomerase family protein [Phycisphaerae bacterium]
MSDILKIDRREARVELTLNRPEARNALSRALIAELTAAIRDAERDETVRCIVVIGTPPAFCAGLDLREVAGTTPEQAEQDATNLLALFETIDNCVKPVIAAVGGPAVAGGAGLVSVCDLVICAQSSVIGYPEVKRGLMPAIVMTYLRRLVGERQAKYLLLTGENLSADRALEFRLCNEVVADVDLLPRARQMADTLAAYPPRALTSTKTLWNKIRGMPHGDAVREARNMNAAMRTSSESRGAISQFLGSGGSGGASMNKS